MGCEWMRAAARYGFGSHVRLKSADQWSSPRSFGSTGIIQFADNRSELVLAVTKLHAKNLFQRGHRNGCLGEQAIQYQIKCAVISLCHTHHRPVP
jgi:hypothetical protein